MGEQFMDYTLSVPTGAQVAAIVAVAVGIALFAAEAYFLYLLVRQNGRLVLRLDAFEQKLATVGMVAAPANALVPAAPPQPVPEGLPVGTEAPAFALSGLFGETMTLAALRAAGKPVTLFFVDPGCGPCNALLPDIARWQREGANELTVALVSRGSADENRAKTADHGLRNVLLQNEREVSASYLVNATPSALVVAADGTIASPVAAGSEQIQNLVAQWTRAAQVVPPAPAPAPPPAAAAVPVAALNGAAGSGRPAPTIQLADVNGRMVDLNDFRGSPTAVLFWNPDCGFCQRMLDDLKNWENNPPAGAPKLLVVSTGSPEQNRAQGLRSAIVLDSGFNKGMAYGVSGTPSAVLVDAEGRIGSPVGVGAPGVFPLLGMAQPADAPAAPSSPAATVGQQAPPVQLPDINGRTVTLDEFRGQNTLVLFWNPDCGFCQRMLDDLKAWENNPPAAAPKLLVVSTGTADQNRAQGIRSTIVLDQGFSRGMAFGVQGTPSAVLVDAQGRVASEVGVGAPAVLSLAGVAS
jgi:peroxiredoxin